MLMLPNVCPSFSRLSHVVGLVRLAASQPAVFFSYIILTVATTLTGHQSANSIFLSPATSGTRHLVVVWFAVDLKSTLTMTFSQMHAWLTYKT
jgi:hypothetical protein